MLKLSKKIICIFIYKFEAAQKCNLRVEFFINQSIIFKIAFLLLDKRCMLLKVYSKPHKNNNKRPLLIHEYSNISLIKTLKNIKYKRLIDT